MGGHRLEVIGSLPFDHDFGACTNFADQKIFLCFNSLSSSDYNKCRWSREPLGTFEQATLTSYDHRQTRVSSSNGDVLAVGSYSSTSRESANIKAELYYGLYWSWAPDYPFSGSYLYRYASI